MERSTLLKCTNHYSINVYVFNSAAFAVLDILRVLERHQDEVMESRIDVNDEKVMTFTATLRLGGDGSSAIDMLRQDILIYYTELMNTN